jgi:hypothetical protein
LNDSLWAFVAAIDAAIRARKPPALFVPPNEHFAAVWAVKLHSSFPRHYRPVARGTNRKLNLFFYRHWSEHNKEGKIDNILYLYPEPKNMAGIIL